jgi:hypothetical protein
MSKNGVEAFLAAVSEEARSSEEGNEGFKCVGGRKQLL